MFASGFTVAAGAMMAVGANVPVVVGSTLSDAGAVTLLQRRPGDTGRFSEFAVSGSLTANGTNFINGGGDSNITFTSTATLSGGTNTFNLPIYVPYTLVASLAGNTSFGQVYIEAGTHLQRHPVAQPDRQQPEHDLCVRQRLHRGRRRDDGGRRERAGRGGVDAERRGGRDLLQRRPGDTWTGYEQFVRQREPDRQRHHFIDGGGDSNITFTSTATLSGGTNTFNLPLYVPYTLVASLAGNTSFDQVYIEAGTHLQRRHWR